MKPIRKQRLTLIILVMLGLGSAIALTLYALRQNINLFYTPSQVVMGQVPKERLFRIGGLVVPGTVVRDKKDLHVRFQLSDTANTVTVDYHGILPDLFREGQGIVAQGKLTNDGMFHAQQVLAKHDEKYMPPEVKYAIKQAKGEYKKR